MKPLVWISSGIAVMAGLGYVGATSLDLGKASPDAKEQGEIAFVPPVAEARIGAAYRGEGDDAFANVAVATVKPFDADGDGISDDVAEMLRLAEDAAEGTTRTAANPALLAPEMLVPEMLVKVASNDLDALANAGQAERGARADDGRKLVKIIPSTWQSRYFADNPLVGTVVDAQGAPSDETALMGAAKGARYLLLGEIHDNPDHHRIQADILDGVAGHERKPAVVFEMIPQSFADTLDAFNASASKDLSALPEELKWEERGWPAFSMYRPIFEAAVRNGLSIEPGDLDRSVVGAIGKEGLSALSQQDIERLSLDRTPDAAQNAEIAEEIKDAHCGLMPDAAIEPMALVQRARDGSLAAAMKDAAGKDGSSVLITGAGHARKDRGVPAVLMQDDPDGGSVAVRMVEVEGADEDEPADYGMGANNEAPYDFTIFTPKSDVTDHCAELRAQMGKTAQ